MAWAKGAAGWLAPGSSKRGWVVTGAAAATAGALLFVATRWPVIDRSPPVQWWIFAAMFCSSELAVVRVRVGRRVHLISAEAIPLVLGMFFVTPGQLVLARATGTVATRIIRPGTALRNVADLSRSTLATTVAVVVFRAFPSGGDVPGRIGSLAAALAVAASVLVTTGLTALVTEPGEERSPRPSARDLASSMAVALGGAGLALLGASHLRADWGDVWLLLVPIVLLVVAYRGYTLQQEREQLLQHLFVEGPVGMVLVDAGSRILKANQAACSMLGYAQAELEGKPVREVIHPEDRLAAARSAKQLMEGMVASASAERRYLARGHRVVWANVTTWAIRDQQGKSRSCLQVLEDITERKNAREKTRRTEERIRRGVLAMTDAREPNKVLQAVVDLARDVLEAEYAALGVLSEDGPELSQFLFSGLDAKAVERIGSHPSGIGLLGAVTAAEHPIRLADVREHPASLGFPDHHPEMRSFLGMPIVYKRRTLGNLYLANKIGAAEFSAEDEAVLLAFAAQAAVVIENARMHMKERELIQELDRSYAELRAAYETKSRFLASVSHEFRTPLNAMQIAGGILSDPAFHPLPLDKVRDLSNTIVTSGRHLLALIDDFLDLSRIEAGRFEVRAEPMPVRRLVTESVGAVRPLAAERRIVLELPEIDPELRVLADPMRVRQILWNLLGNALKFTNPGGRVWIDVRTPDSSVVIEVCDTGVGVAAKDQERIFAPFEQVGEAVSGAGLGLAISLGIAQAHGGALTVTSEPGSGSRFALTLPRADELVGGAGRSPDEDLHTAGLDALRPATVLVVEDDASARQLAVQVLESAGYDTLGVETLAEAVGAIRESTPEVVLLDLRLGQDDGVELVRLLRNMPGTQDVPVLATSGSVSSAEVDRAMAAGCNEFLPKPLSARQILRHVRGALTGPA